MPSKKELDEQAIKRFAEHGKKEVEFLPLETKELHLFVQFVADMPFDIHDKLLPFFSKALKGNLTGRDLENWKSITKEFCKQHTQHIILPHLAELLDYKLKQYLNQIVSYRLIIKKPVPYCEPLVKTSEREFSDIADAL